MQATKSPKHVADKTELVLPYFLSLESTTEQRLVLYYERFMEQKNCPNQHNQIKIKMQEAFDRFVNSIKIVRQAMTGDKEYMYESDEEEGGHIQKLVKEVNDEEVPF